MNNPLNQKLERGSSFHAILVLLRQNRSITWGSDACLLVLFGTAQKMVSSLQRWKEDDPNQQPWKGIWHLNPAWIACKQILPAKECLAERGMEFDPS